MAGASSGASSIRAGVSAEGRTPTGTCPIQIFEDDILFIQWSAVSEKSRVRDGVDTFVFRDGLIRVQTVFRTLEPIS